MTKGNFVPKIKPFFEIYLENIVEEAQKKYLDPVYDGLTPRGRLRKIKEYAQLLLISRLVEHKGGYLSVIEMQYTLDLFHDECKAYDGLNSISLEGRKSTGILSEACEYMETQKREVAKNKKRMDDPAY